MSSKKNYDMDLFVAGNTWNKFYGYFKPQPNATSSIPCMQKANGEYAVADHERAREFSEYFASVFVKDNNVIPTFEPNCVMGNLINSNVVVCMS